MGVASLSVCVLCDSVLLFWVGVDIVCVDCCVSLACLVIVVDSLGGCVVL